jgi:16S rRNA G527 N7-methylase RsmG
VGNGKVFLKNLHDSKKLITIKAKVLSKYLVKNRNKYEFKGKRVIEVGAGCGLNGLVLSILGADVTLTDQGYFYENVH